MKVPLSIKVDHSVDTVLRLAAEASNKDLTAYTVESILRCARIQASETKNEALARAVDGARAAVQHAAARFRPGAELVHAPVSGPHGQLFRVGTDRSTEIRGTTKQCGPGLWSIYTPAGARVGSVLRLTTSRFVARWPGHRGSQMFHSFSAAAAALLLKETP